jgi:uncharacterized protein involved in outer membrane biogenesis
MARPTHRRHRHRKLWIPLTILLVLVAIRAALPFVVEKYVNDELDAMEGYDGHVADVDLHLWRGAYSIEDVEIVKTEGKVDVPFFAAERVDLSLKWSALFDGALVGEVELQRPAMNFVKGKSKATSQTEPAEDWRETVKELFPLKIDELRIVNGEIHYREPGADPPFDLYFDQVQATLANLTNSEDLSETLVATAKAEARLMKSGRTTLDLSIDPFAEKPTFDLNLAVRGVDLREFNDFLRAYANLDVERGRASIYAEVQARRGAFKGYVKPLFEDLDVLRWEEEDESVPEKAWQAVAGTAAELLENQDKDRLATKVPLEGTFDNPNPELWATVGGVLRNAFVEAFLHGVEGEIGLGRFRENVGWPSKDDEKKAREKKKDEDEDGEKRDKEKKRDEDDK